MKPVSYWISSEVLSVANIFILSSLSDSRGLCWALLVSNTGPCNYPMYKQQTPVCVLAVLSPWSRVILPPHLSEHCQPDTGEMVSIKPSWTSISIWKSFPDIRLWLWSDLTGFLLTAAGVAIGWCRIIKCQYTGTPLRGSIIVYIYNLYLVCHYLIREKNSTRQGPGPFLQAAKTIDTQHWNAIMVFAPAPMSGL